MIRGNIWAKLLLRGLRVAVLVYIGMMLLIYFAQRKLIYHPQKLTMAEAVQRTANTGYEPWRNRAGDYIGWKYTSKTPAAARILVVHGNAGSAVGRIGDESLFQNMEPMDVYILEYPGYGPRAGAPTQASLLAAADEAAALLDDGRPTYLFGESLGTGVACWLVGAHPQLFRGVLLVAPYHDLTEVAAHHYPWLPVRWLMKDRFPAAAWLANYRGPVAFLLARDDVIVPSYCGRHLYDAYPGPKQVWEIAQADHNDLIDRPEAWWEELGAFWKQHIAAAPAGTIQ